MKKVQQKKLSVEQQEVIKAWESEICQNAELIDPSNEFEWQSMFVGFAIAKGLSIEEATDYILYINYAFPLEVT